MARLRTTSIMACWGLMLGFLAEGFAQVQPPVLVAKAEANLASRATQAQDFDIFQSDAFIGDVFTSVDVAQYNAAAQTYLSLLAQLDRPLTAPEQAILIKHLRLVALILPAPERDEMGLDQALAQSNLAPLSQGSGARLAQWWRRQDTLPATENNERLEEHLTRVAVAMKRYPSEDDARGFDDRGEIYIRLGAPSNSTSVDNKKPALLMLPTTSRIPENEFWVYEHLGYDAHYLFLRKTPKSPFELGFPTDLIPHQLRNGPRNAPTFLVVMEEVFGQLALYHTAFGTHYDEVADYLTLPPRNAGAPHLFGLSAFRRAFTEERQQEWNRQQTVPASYSKTFGLAQDLSVPMRWARFLDPDSTTRTEIYWGLEAHALKPSRRLVRRLKKRGHIPSEEYLLSLAVAQQTADYQYRAINKKHYLIPVDAEGDLPVRIFVVRGDTATYHLAMQWDQQWTRPNEEQPDALLPGARLKLGTQRIDTVQALYSLGHRLEMSDLKPLLRSREEALETDPPYPYAHLTPSTPLALYFELYHLTFGADDQTHYLIEYEVSRSRSKGGLLRLPGPRVDQRTTAQTTYSGNSRTAKEYIALDLSTWQGRGNVDITIRATDETSGAQVARTITFTMKK